MKMASLVLLSFFLLFGLVACTNSNDKEDAKFNNIQSVYEEFSLDNISEIKVINGDNGGRISITDKEQIKQIFDAFSKLSIKDMGKPEEVPGGYTYSIRFYNGNEKVLSVVYGSIVMDQLIINRYLYIVEDKSVLESAIDYFNENTQ